MKQARDNPSVKKYGEEYSSRFTLNQLRNNNTNFELLQKSLEEFLQKKREIFGRFFLLSNMELLEILSNVKEHRDIERYLGKVFQSVANVVIDDKDNITGLKGT
jgi:dynein heavy chain